MALSDNLAAYYKLDESSGSASAAFGGAALTETNGPIVSAAGKIATSRLLVRASSQYFTVADNSLFSMGNISFSISVWAFLVSKPAGPMTIVAKREAGGNLEYQLMWDNTTDRFIWRVSNDGSAFVAVTANTFGAPSLSTWYHIGVSHDATADLLSIRVNAGTANTQAHATGVFDGTAAFKFGSGQANNEIWDGRIDEVGVWKGRALGNDEWSQLYNSGNGISFSQIESSGPWPLAKTVYRPVGVPLYDMR